MERAINMVGNSKELRTDQYCELLFEPGDGILAFRIIKKYLESAKREILIIDNNFGHRFDCVLRKINVKKIIVTSSDNKRIKSCKNYEVIRNDRFDSRFIFVDDCCYCFGDNFEDVGNFISSAIMVLDKNHFNLIKSCALDTNE